MNMWMDLLKQSPLDERYCDLAMEGLVGLFRMFVGGGVSRTIPNMLKFIV